MNERKELIQLVMDTPDEKIEALFREMCIIIDLSGGTLTMDIETRESDDIMSTNIIGNYR
jgi:hypothetical protein